MVERWLEMQEQGVERTGPMSVVLSPTRELAKQLGDHLKALCDGLPSAPYVCVVTGGLSILKQQRQLEKADIVIGTPGRLWEVLSGDRALQSKFAKIKFLVVDEADRLFKVGQFKEAEDIIGALDGKSPGDDAESSDEEDEDEEDEHSARQTLVFSATFDKDLQTKLAGKGKSTGSDDEKMAYLMKCLKFRGEPKFIDVNPISQMASGLREGLIECGAMEKVSLQYKCHTFTMLTNYRIFTFIPFLSSTLVAALLSSPTLSRLSAVSHPFLQTLTSKLSLCTLKWHKRHGFALWSVSLPTATLFLLPPMLLLVVSISRRLTKFSTTTFPDPRTLTSIDLVVPLVAKIVVSVLFSARLKKFFLRAVSQTRFMLSAARVPRESTLSRPFLSIARRHHASSLASTCPRRLPIRYLPRRRVTATIHGSATLPTSSVWNMIQTILMRSTAVALRVVVAEAEEERSRKRSNLPRRRWVLLRLS